MAETVIAEHGPFAADEVELLGLRGTLDVRVVEGRQTRLSVEGPSKAVAALDVRFDGSRLVAEAPASGSSVSVARSVTVVTGPGATSNVTIGGSSVASGEAAEPVAVVLEMPAGRPFALRGFAGEASIGDLESDVVAAVVGGTTRLGAVHSAELAAVGNARLEVASVIGDLVANVTGAGRIDVAAGLVETAAIAVTGSGAVAVEARIERAEVNMVGGGMVRLADVAEPPSVSRVGAGTVEIGG